MKVILTQTVPKVGKEGHVVNVANGYARNYLFPQKMAVYADKAQLSILERRLKILATADAKTLAAAEGTHEKANGKVLRIEGKVAGDNTRLFGAVTAQDIADAIKAQLGVEVDRKQVGLVTPIKRLGKYRIELDMHRQLDTHVALEVFNPEAIEAEEKAAPVAAEEPAAAVVEEPEAVVEEEAPEPAVEEEEAPVEA